MNVVVALLVLAGVAFLAFSGRQAEPPPSWALPAPAPDDTRPTQQGGVGRLAVLSPPEYSDTGEGGATLRQLTWPAPFVAYPDGTWRASLAQPGTDGASLDGTRVFFGLRPGARWSDGSPITIEDLRRTVDRDYVASVNLDARGLIVVDLKNRMPDWRRLWAGGIEPPGVGVSGGPFVLQSVTSGLETALVRNDQWFLPPPALDRLNLVLTADAVQARLLLKNGDIDVYRAVDDTVRTTQLRALPGVVVDRSDEGGTVVGLRLDNGDLSVAQRRALSDAFPRQMFVRSLLAGEATELFGLQGGEQWKSPLDREGDSLSGARVGFAAPPDLPLGPLLASTVAETVRRNGGVFDPAGAADVVVDRRRDGPTVCWRCRFGTAEPELARRADGGDGNAVDALQQKLRQDGRYLPLWKADEVVAHRPQSVGGVVPNGYVNGNAWGAERWFRPG